MSDQQAQALEAMIEAVKVGTWCDHMAPSWGEEIHLHAHAAFDGSLDAAIALHEALLPDWSRGRFLSGGMIVSNNTRASSGFSVNNPIASRALLLATLRAYRATLDAAHSGDAPTSLAPQT